MEHGCWQACLEWRGLRVQVPASGEGSGGGCWGFSWWPWLKTFWCWRALTFGALKDKLLAWVSPNPLPQSAGLKLTWGIPGCPLPLTAQLLGS